MSIGTLGLAFLAGLLSILSPCVLPLLPIVLGAAASEHRLGPIALAAGVALSFVAIGLFIATIGFGLGLDGDVFRFVAAAYERRSLGIASHWPFEQWGRFLPEHTTAVSLLDRLLHHNNVVATDGESYRMREARTRSGGRPSTT